MGSLDLILVKDFPNESILSVVRIRGSHGRSLFVLIPLNSHFASIIAACAICTFNSWLQKASSMPMI